MGRVNPGYNPGCEGGGGGVHTGGESGFEFELEPSCKCCLWLISGLYISAEN